jgi:transcriptional regulator with XRE-family HTH domain
MTADSRDHFVPRSRRVTLDTWRKGVWADAPDAVPCCPRVQPDGGGNTLSHSCRKARVCSERIPPNTRPCLQRRSFPKKNLRSSPSRGVARVGCSGSTTDLRHASAPRPPLDGWAHGVRHRAARKPAELSVRQLAQLLDISPSTLTRIRQGKRPDADTLAVLLAWLDVPPGELLSVDDPVVRIRRPRRSAAVIFRTQMAPPERRGAIRPVSRRPSCHFGRWRLCYDARSA